MKTLLIAESRQGKLLPSCTELLAFAARTNAQPSMFLVGSETELPQFPGRLYLADASRYGEYNPDLHKRLLLEAVKRENPDHIVFLHSSYGWDLAPRIAMTLKVSQVSEVLAVEGGKFVVPACNAKMRRLLEPRTSPAVLTLQPGAFSEEGLSTGNPQIERIDLPDNTSRLEFLGYEQAESSGHDLTRAAVIVSAGRGVGKKENVELVAALARLLGGELGATRPVVDASWSDHSRQVGTTGQVVAPKLYLACGISGAIHHLAGMKKSAFIVAINTDREAPIADVAHVLVVADVLQFIPALTARLAK